MIFNIDSNDNEIPKQAIEFSYAFQPIINASNQTIFSYEALIRGPHDSSAESVISKISERYSREFDQYSRNHAINLAAKLKLQTKINLNFISPTLESSNKYLLQTSEKMREAGFSEDQLVIEITEESVIHQPKKLIEIVNSFRARGMLVAIDDFGAGYSGLSLLVNFQPDLIKLDSELIRNINSHGPRQSIIKAVREVCISLGIDLIAEGIETIDEYHWLRDHGIDLFQGYLFAKAGFEMLPEPHFI